MELEIFGDGYELLEIIVRAAIMYIFAVAMLRIFGKRTTMTTAGFDLVFTIALGSILASTIVSPGRPIIQGMAAVAALAALQWALSLGVSRNAIIQQIAVSPAKVLLRDGQVMRDSLLEERLSLEQMEQNIRQQGYANTESLSAVILESSGNISVIGQTDTDGELIDRAEIGSRAI